MYQCLHASLRVLGRHVCDIYYGYGGDGDDDDEAGRGVSAGSGGANGDLVFQGSAAEGGGLGLGFCPFAGVVNGRLLG